MSEEMRREEVEQLQSAIEKASLALAFARKELAASTDPAIRKRWADEVDRLEAGIERTQALVKRLLHGRPRSDEIGGG